MTAQASSTAHQVSDPVRFLDLGTTHGQIRDALDAAWVETMETNGFIGGPHLESFENEFATYCQANACVGVANGTDALELILRGLGIGAGDEVIIPTNTFVATAEAVVAVGALPVFTDVDPRTALITGDHVRAAMTPRTAAVMAVHLYGQMVDVDDLQHVAGPAGIAIIEDAAQAHGATWNERRAGSAGVAAGFSFYPGKNLGALGDAGAITTSDVGLADRIRSIANHGRSRHSKYEHDLVGRNSRLDGLQAAVLRVKLPKLDRWNAGRRAAAELYLNNLPDGFVPYAESEAATGVYHLFVVRSTAVDRDVVGAFLDAQQIQWGIHYPVPCHRQLPFVDGTPSFFETADVHAGQMLSLPMHPHLEFNEILRVCDELGTLG